MDTHKNILREKLYATVMAAHVGHHVDYNAGLLADAILAAIDSRLAAAVAGREGQAQPWPVRDCLTKLTDAAEHLLRDHDCDHHGHEEVRAAINAAREHEQPAPAQPQASSASGGRAEIEYGWLIEHARSPAPMYAQASRAGYFTWTLNAHEALRLARKCDAENVARLLDGDAGEIVEHAFCGEQQARERTCPDGFHEEAVHTLNQASSALREFPVCAPYLDGDGGPDLVSAINALTNERVEVVNALLRQLDATHEAVKGALSCDFESVPGHRLRAAAEAMQRDLRAAVPALSLPFAPYAFQNPPQASEPKPPGHICGVPDHRDPCPECRPRDAARPAAARKFQFRVEQETYETDRRSLSALEIKDLAGVPANYRLFLERRGKEPDEALAEVAAVDLTGEVTQFYAVPPISGG